MTIPAGYIGSKVVGERLRCSVSRVGTLVTAGKLPPPVRKHPWLWRDNRSLAEAISAILKPSPPAPIRSSMAEAEAEFAGWRRRMLDTGTPRALVDRLAQDHEAVQASLDTMRRCRASRSDGPQRLRRYGARPPEPPSTCFCPEGAERACDAPLCPRGGRPIPVDPDGNPLRPLKTGPAPAASAVGCAAGLMVAEGERLPRGGGFV